MPFSSLILCAIRVAILPSFCHRPTRTLLRVAREGYGMLIQRDREGNQMATPRLANRLIPRHLTSSVRLVLSLSLSPFYVRDLSDESDEEGRRFRGYSLWGLLSACVRSDLLFFVKWHFRENYLQTRNALLQCLRFLFMAQMQCFDLKDLRGKIYLLLCRDKWIIFKGLMNAFIFSSCSRIRVIRIIHDDEFVWSRNATLLFRVSDILRFVS